MSWQFLWKAASPCNIQAQSMALFIQYTVHSMEKKLSPVVAKIPWQYIILETPLLGVCWSQIQCFHGGLEIYSSFYESY